MHQTSSNKKTCRLLQMEVGILTAFEMIAHQKGEASLLLNLRVLSLDVETTISLATIHPPVAAPPHRSP